MKNSPHQTSKNSITTATAIHVLRDDGIIQVNILPNSEIDLEKAIASVEAGKQLSGGIKRPVLIVFGKIAKLNREARVYLSGPDTATHSAAMGLVIESKVSKIIGNFMIGLNKSTCPTKLFNSESEAVGWLKTYLK